MKIKNDTSALNSTLNNKNNPQANKLDEERKGIKDFTEDQISIDTGKAISGLFTDSDRSQKVAKLKALHLEGKLKPIDSSELSRAMNDYISEEISYERQGNE